MGGSTPMKITPVQFMTGAPSPVQAGDFEQLLIHEHSDLVRKYGGNREDYFFGGHNWFSVLCLYDSYNDLYCQFQRSMNAHLSQLLTFERRLRKQSHLGPLTDKLREKLRESERQLTYDVKYEIMRKIKSLKLRVTYHRSAISQIFSQFSSGDLSPTDFSPHGIIFLASHIEPITSTIFQHLEFLKTEALITCHSLEENQFRNILEIEQDHSTSSLTSTSNPQNTSQIVKRQKSSSSLPSSVEDSDDETVEDSSSELTDADQSDEEFNLLSNLILDSIDTNLV